MNVVNVDLGENSYPIYIGNNLFVDKQLIHTLLNGSQVMIVTNTTVKPLYLDQLLDQLNEFKVTSIALQDGEQYKTLASVNQIFDELLNQRFSRNATLIALGGGVVGDMTGFAAACYLRGINFIQIPTTLLAQVDSSVGGKTGVNHPLGKNMIGAFYQPQGVFADTSVLHTLPERELMAGVAEVIKYGLIYDIEFLAWLENHVDQILKLEDSALSYAIQRSCEIKAAIVSADEKESGLRAILNLGHTFGHAIEAGCGYGQYLHGEAVAIGMCLALELSHRLQRINLDDVVRGITLIERTGLPSTLPPELTADDFLRLMAVDKKNVDGNIRVIVLNQLGQAALPETVNSGLLRQTINEYGDMRS
ncbi:MAG: 3-dehydroquinate synthase [Gammaproteobacteria bacterium]|nr:3-dehydroquinate synthase [Gammaproteobacteria bacterium]